MFAIERSALILVGKEPYLEWINKTADSHKGDTSLMTMEDVTAEPDVILIPDFEDERDVETHLESIYAKAFEELLIGWCVDEALWPKDRTLAMFRDWFNISYTTLVYDSASES